MSSSGRLRLFVAASVPAPLLAELARATVGLRERWPSARWTPPENQHVTLKFLGWVDEGLTPALHEVVATTAAEHDPAKVSLAGLGVFPGPTAARVLWAGLDDPKGLLRSLANDLDERLEPLGFESEQRPFRAHVTLARFKERVRADGLPGLDLGENAVFGVQAIELFRSHLSPRGPRYEVVRSFPLGGRAP
ncbi:MAG: RNA 2',3'-cyclic phosphodiesterase [Actinomycetota bacterium]|nr:RNA 2',3'-cyclic phosphodiesterase [Actinomycetota bacterium]